MIFFTAAKCSLCLEFYESYQKTAEQISGIQEEQGSKSTKMEFFILDISQNDVYIADITNKTSITAPSSLLFVDNEYLAEYHGGSLNP